MGDLTPVLGIGTYHEPATLEHLLVQSQRRFDGTM
jgi:hypothetical protein